MTEIEDKEIERLVDEKYKKLNGLVSRDGAFDIVMDELGLAHNFDYQRGKRDAQKEFLDWLETLFKSDDKGTPYQFFKDGVYQTKYNLFVKIKELKQSLNQGEKTE
jgi:hypothetical protein